MEYDRDDSFPFDFETSGIPFGSKSKGRSMGFPKQAESSLHHFRRSALNQCNYIVTLIQNVNAFSTYLYNINQCTSTMTHQLYK